MTRNRDSVSGTPKENKKEQQNSPVIVGIGASAGGLNALEKFFSNASPDSGFAYVVIQHLDPDRKSMLPEILQRYTKMKVFKVEDKVRVSENTVYVIPPGYFVKLENERLILEEQKKVKGLRLPINHFFRSLKSEKQERAIGIILSGTGSDGTSGIKEIKEGLGMIMVQDPESAEHTGMPENAIKTGIVDFILPPEKMPAKIVSYVKGITENRIEKVGNNGIKEKKINELLSFLKDEIEHDFTNYKKSTILRRISRRLAVNSLSDIDDYIRYIKSNKQEIEALFKDLLIGVTSFFRDQKAFASLEEKVIPEILKNNKKGEVRIWVPGCSTGEEAYTIAILFHQQIKNNDDIDIQVFASDIDEEALQKARQGKYNIDIASQVPEHILKQYFKKTGDTYLISKEIRDMLIFAQHSIIKDSPYSALDLISCRNILIYLDNQLQDKILNLFHYALNENGFIFLGNSESIGQRNQKLFNEVDAKQKIYSKSNVKSNILDYWNFINKPKINTSNKVLDKKIKKPSLKEYAEKLALTRYMHPFIIISKQGDLLYSLGKIGEYFGLKPGEPTYNIIDIAIEDLKFDITNALRLIKTGRKTLTYDSIRIKREGSSKYVRLSFTPIEKPSDFSDLYIVLIEPLQPAGTAGKRKARGKEKRDSRDQYIDEIEHELDATTEKLQNVIEQYEASNEELKTANEEAQSTNEELQSANEELETSKEELQSLNEELETSNSELQRKVHELSQANDIINNFITSTQIGVLFLDKEMVVQRFTPQVKKIFNLVDTDIGRTISSFVSNLNYKGLVDDCHKVLDNLIPVESEVSFGTTILWMRILPYRTAEDKINGVVITFTDITEQKRLQEDARSSRERYKKLFENILSGIIVQELLYDRDGKAVDARIIEVNDAYTYHTGVKKENVLGKRVKEVFPNARNDLFGKFVRVVRSGRPYESVEYSPQLGKFIRLSAFTFEKDRYVTVFEDITEQKENELAVKASGEKFKSLFDNMVTGVAINEVLFDKDMKVIEADFLDVNPAFRDVLQIGNENIEGTPVVKTLTMMDRKSVLKLFEKAKREKFYSCEYYWKRKDKHLSFNVFSLHGDQYAIILADITPEKKELETRQYLASLVESSEDAIYSLNTDGKILSWNKGAQKFYGFEENEIIGKHISILYEKYTEQQMELIEDVRKGKKRQNVELKQRDKQGKELFVSLTKSPIFNQKGEVIAISDIVKDMSVVKQREKELLKSREKIAESGRLKTAFLQNMSHEIRTPMNSILGFTEILKKRIKDPETRKLVKAIDINGNQLVHLIDELMDISRIESGELTLQKMNFNLEELLKEIKRQFEGVKRSRKKDNIDLRLSLPDDTKSIILHSDKFRLQQIMGNLLSNAIKYTKEGFIEFGYRKEDENKLLFFVKDTGEGISEENLNRIFDRFTRLDPDSGEFNGTGLGLTIVKGLTQLLEGEIWCDSAPGKGSTFYVILPDSTVHKDIETNGEAKMKKTEKPDLKGKTILIAEDDEFSFEMMNLVLSETGAKIFHAKDGKEVVDLLGRVKVDLFLLDIQLPKLGGYDLLKLIREKDGLVPVVAQTAYAMVEDKNKSREAGFDEHLTKPIEIERLYEILHRFLL